MTSEEPKVTDCACYEGREEVLKDLQKEIDACEKALNEYLEEKKKCFQDSISFLARLYWKSYLTVATQGELMNSWLTASMV